MRGRPPIPKAIHELRGFPGKRRHKEIEPTPPEGFPTCPDHLDDIATAEWHDTCRHLYSMNLLSLADRAALELYCISYSRYRRAAENVQKFGDVILSPTKKYPMISPWASVMNQAFEQCRKMLVEFALTPSARSRARVSVDEKKDDKWEGLISVA